MHGARDRSILAALILASAMGLAGCSGASMVEQLPASVGGEPAGAPERPTTVYAYPAVHDLPPPRATAPLSEEDQVKMEKELGAARDSQEAREAADKEPVQPAKKKPGEAAKKKPDTASNGQAAGTQDGAKTNP
jgi:hypothetical protein